MTEKKIKNNMSSSGLTRRSRNKDFMCLLDARSGSGMTSARDESGRTMTEMLAVIGIIGVLSVGGMTLGGYVIGGIKANRVVSGLQERILLAQKRRIVGQSTTFRDRRIQEDILGLYPVKYQKGVTDDTIPIYYGKKIIVSEIPQRVCEGLKKDASLQATLDEVGGIISFNDGGEDGACKEENNEFFVLFGGRSEGKCHGRNNGCMACDEYKGEWVVDEAKDGTQIQDICHQCSNGNIVAKEKGKVVPCGNKCCTMFETCDAEEGCVTRCPADSSYNNFSGDQIGNSDCYCNAGYRVDAFQTGCIYSPTCRDEECIAENECMRCNVEKDICENACQDVEYLESTGTQWIDTGITLPSIIPSFKIKLKSKEYHSAYYLPLYVGVFNGGSRSFGIWKPTNSQMSIVDYNRNISTVDIESSREWNEVIYNRNAKTFTVDGTTVSTEAQSWYSANPTNFALFASKTYNDTSARVSKVSIAYCQLFDGENLIKDFIPVISPDGEACMFDKVSKKLFRNSGTGTFKTNLD